MSMRLCGSRLEEGGDRPGLSRRVSLDGALPGAGTLGLSGWGRGIDDGTEAAPGAGKRDYACRAKAPAAMMRRNVIARDSPKTIRMARPPPRGRAVKPATA